MVPNKQQLKVAIKDISFEMNRYLYAAQPNLLTGRYPELVRESCLLHSRIIGEFFFVDGTSKDDIRILDYYNVLKSKDELENEIEKSRLKWKDYKERIDKKLCHLTLARINQTPMNMDEKEHLKFGRLIELFENNLPSDYKENWAAGKKYSE